MRALVATACLLGACTPGQKVPVAPVDVVAHVPITAQIQIRVDAWTRLSAATEGTTVEAQAPEDVPKLIRDIFDRGIPDGPVDVVFVVDTTGSMEDDIDAVKADMRQIIEHLSRRNPEYRIGVVTYRDIYDVYLTRTNVTLTDDDAAISAAIAGITVTGGDDWREHVYAGITTALDGQPWSPRASQHILLMGDAPPHDDYDNDPRTHESVTSKAHTAPLRVRIHTIGIKCDQDCEAALAAEAVERSRTGRLVP